MSAKTIGTHIAEWMTDNARNAWDIDATLVLNRFNKYYHELETQIATFVMDGYFDSELTFDLVANQDTYLLPWWNSGGNDTTAPQFFKLLECSVKYKDNGKYLLAREYPDGDQPYPQTFYSEKEPKLCPMFKITRKSIKIFPTPTENVEDWLLIRYAWPSADVSATTKEDELTIPRQYIPVILDWCSWQNAITVRDPNVLMFKQNYQEWVQKMLWELSDRYVQPTAYRNPYLRYLMN